VGAKEDRHSVSELFLCRCSKESLSRHSKVRAPVVSPELAFVAPSGPEESPPDASPHLYLLTGTELNRRPVSQKEGGFRGSQVTVEESARRFVDADNMFSSVATDIPPTLCGDTLFLHRHGTLRAQTSLEMDLTKALVHGEVRARATGVAAFAKAPAFWEAYHEGDTDALASLLDDIASLPAPSGPPDSIDLIDCAVEDGEIQAVLAEEGLCDLNRLAPAADLRPNESSEAKSESEETEKDAPGGIRSNSTLTWEMWLGDEESTRAVYHEAVTTIFDYEPFVEALHPHPGRFTCLRASI